MKIKLGMTVITPDGTYIIKRINRKVKPALVLLTEKYRKKSFGRRIYTRENLLQTNE
jgi:hypothetical protein